MSTLSRMSKGTTAAWALLAIMVAMLVAPLAAIASAQEDSENTGSLRGTVRAGRDIVAGAELTVLDADGNVVEQVTSGEDGTWSVQVPGVGEYLVQLDVGTLPDDVALQEGAVAEVSRVVDQVDRPVSVSFQLERGGTTVVAVDPTWQRFLNRCVSGLKVGLLVALAAVGLSLIFGVTGLVNFAHSELVAFGAVIAWGIEQWTGWPFLLVILVAVSAGGLLGLVLERGLFGPLRRRKMTNISLMVVSIGLAFVMRYLIQIYFGSEKENYDAWKIQRSFDVGPISLPPKDYYIIGTAFVVLILVGLLLQRTKLGTAMRAVSDNPPLARSSGIDVDRTILAVWMMGSALAALGGIMLGLTQVVEWQMGEQILLLIFAAVTLGGLGTAYGAMLGGLAIGFASEVSTFWLDNDLKFLVALVALIVILLVRPQGILGVRERLG